MIRNRIKLLGFLAFFACFAVSCGSDEWVDDPQNKCDLVCVDGEAKCSEFGQQFCEIAADGCWRWGRPQACSTGQVCEVDRCVASDCSSECTVGATRCFSQGRQSCEADGRGCGVWGTPQTCPSGQSCIVDRCVSSSSDECKSGAAKCSTQGLQVCETGTDKRTRWGTPQPCPTGQFCQLDRCVLSCFDECDVFERICAEDGYKTCVDGAAGCRVWSSVSYCSGGKVCRSGYCESCEYHYQCESSKVCMDGSCVVASGREYVFEFISADIPERDPYGYSWDPGGGLPDPFVSFWVDGESVGMTSTKRDTLHPIWLETMVARLYTTSEISVIVYDDDFSEGGSIQRVDGFTHKNPLFMIRNGEGWVDGPLYDGSTTSIFIKITPR